MICIIYFPSGPTIATRNGLSRSLHVGIYVIMSFLYTLLFLYVICWQNKIILILILSILLFSACTSNIDSYHTAIVFWKLN